MRSVRWQNDHERREGCRRDFLETFSTDNVDAFIDRLTDDGTWWVAGRIPGMAGVSSKETLGALLGQVGPLYKAGALRITPASMIAEGNLVAVEASSYAELEFLVDRVFIVDWPISVAEKTSELFSRCGSRGTLQIESHDHYDPAP